jgi:hypothetical protein
MCAALRTIVFALIAIVSGVADNVRPAMAQATTDDPLLIKAGTMVRYARYYAPYAIHAAAAYLSVKDFDDAYRKMDADGYGTDVNIAVRNIFGGTVNSAQQAIKAWQYQFGSDSYLSSCIDPDDSDCKSALHNRGRVFGDGPGFQVWARARAAGGVCREVSIAFRGTRGLTSGWDWVSNADRWYGSPYDDYYYQLRRNINGIIKRIKGLDCYRPDSTRIVSTGHSLGGGLAQFAALANNANGSVRISKVFAFDPSPVTGAHLIDKQTLNANSQGLTIDRIYQEGEVLSLPRRLIQEYPPAQSFCGPFVRTVKVDAVPGGGAVGLHSMNPLAVKILDLSYGGDVKQQVYLAPPTSPDPKKCKLRYSPPTTDEDTVVVAGVGTRVTNDGARQALSASTSRYGEYADQSGTSYALDLQPPRSVEKLAAIRVGKYAPYGQAPPFGTRPPATDTALAMMPGRRVDKRLRAIHSYRIVAQADHAAFSPLPAAQ